MNKNQQQEHTGSYYAATANWSTAYPELRESLEADVCVVGAGFTGIAAALTLAERGFSVAVVEANRVSWGASGRNGGQLIHGFSSDQKIAARMGAGFEKTLWKLIWRGHEIIRERVQRYGIACDLKPGFIEVASKSSHMNFLEQQDAYFRKNQHQHEFRLLDREETRVAVGSDQFYGGFLTMGNGHLHPMNLCIGEARAAEGLGVRIFERSPVTHVEHGARPRVHTARGHVTADSVVLAGNAYHNLEPKHLSGLVFPAGSYIIATEALDEDLLKSVNPMDLAVCTSNEIVDYYRCSADGRMLYGGRCNYSGRDPASIEESIRPRMLKVYPQLKDVQIEFEWGGKIGIVLNRVPIMGRIGDNVYYAQGYSGHGVNATHIMGEIVADAIGGTMEKFDVFSQFEHFRIPGGQWVGNQLIALGMLYYRLRDALS
ncbi:MAG: FAD-binding oxidoreductase [Xanthomonadales bacterium]|nr:FAD-binding oxidoreductase [Xanthomonadales bacterium]